MKKFINKAKRDYKTRAKQKKKVYVSTPQCG